MAGKCPSVTFRVGGDLQDLQQMQSTQPELPGIHNQWGNQQVLSDKWNMLARSYQS